MRTLNALFVGIDDYPVAPLRGCVNDVREAEAWLRRQGHVASDIRRLHDGDATLAAVRAGIEQHLGRSGPGDTALLWFSGHGTEEPTDAPWEGTGRSQALVCHDSLGDGGPPLWDTELGALLDGIAARGAHVVAVLDCCHSGGATRTGATVRAVPWRPWWSRTAPGGRDGGSQGPLPRRHTLLAACRPQERAHENVLDGQTRGYFSHALLEALGKLGPSATYGGLHALAGERVRRLTSLQHPELRGGEDRLFLSGGRVPGSPFLLRHTAAGWEVDCGAAHGLRAAGAEFTLLDGDGTPRTVAVREVRTESALVDPVDWRPQPGDRDAVFGVTPSALAFPPAAVSLTGDPGVVRLIEAAVAGAPMLSTAATATGGVPLRVDAGPGLARVSGGAGRELPPLPVRSPADADRVVDCLTHLARWQRLRDLVNPDPWLSSLVRITVESTGVGTVRHSADGEIVCSYTADHRPPQVMVGVHNDSDRPLWCVLLDLTDSHASSVGLYDGDFVGAGHTGRARRGQPVWLYLPPGRAVVPGAFTRDWLKVIVAETELNTAPFVLDPWSPGVSPAARTGGEPGAAAGLLRLTAPPGGRDAGGPPQGPGRWGTAQVRLRTEVP
ncbi:MULTISPECIES: caspase family protein [Streptomyces]|uniref:Caspase family protein n=1 Tax=Streptomyces edwardsiae TaxID=3075527 RepID=A0ABU2PR45_9ACTN|nr:caspase family protein [Streptomyces sp. DSM 41636]MDT0393225.1 caspase family protein [Streptomyces sp. DSM 41636]